MKGEDNDWGSQATVQLQVRHTDRFVERAEDAWPIPTTQWTKFYLTPDGTTLETTAPTDEGQVTFAALGDGVTFLSAPLETDTEITGPSACKLVVSSSTTDADLFLVLRVFDPSGKEIVFQGAIDPNTPIGQGWLRASHRKLDTALSQPWRPYHSHNEVQPLAPGEPVELDIEIWPTSLVIPAGSRIALTVRGKDYEYPDAQGARLSNFKNVLRGCGPFLHDDPRDRPAEIFGGETTLHIGPDQPAYLLLPVIPPRK